MSHSLHSFRSPRGRAFQRSQHDHLARIARRRTARQTDPPRNRAHSHAGTSHDDRSPQCLVACGGAISRANGAAGDRRAGTPGRPSIVAGCRGLLPSKSSTLSPLALDIVAHTARRAESGSIVIIRASHDDEAAETAQTAVFRGDAVRDELVREGVANSAIRILISDAAGTGIAARSVVVSIIHEAFDE